MSFIYAHRGASGHAPENTLEAFALAVSMGADGVELDVHISADGELIVIHDEKVDRTTNGTGYVKDMTLQQLKALDASNGKEGYQGAKIPTLAEVYDLLRDTGLHVNVEIKTDQIMYPDIEKKCLEMEREKGMEGRVIYSSFNHYTIANLLRLNPNAKTGLLYMSGLYQPWTYAKSVGATHIHPFFPSIFLPDLPQGCAENGVGINLWTVNDPKVMALCVQCGAGIITDYPDVAVQVRRKASEK
jgi:glycerophosphoryl diester phosphodiesterase